MSRRKDYLKYFAGLLIFGSNGVVASGIGLSSYEIVLLRSFLGTILLTILFFASGHRVTARGRPLFWIALSGAMMAADWLFLFEAYQRIGVSLGMVINYCGPAIVVALSIPIFHERLTWQKAAALAAALIGAFCIVGETALKGVSAWGLLCAVLSAFSYAGMVIFNKLSKTDSGMENATLELFFCLVVVAAFVGARQGFAMDIDAADVPRILCLGLFNTGLGCYFYFSSIGSLPAQTVAICGYLEPLTSVVLAMLILGETMGPMQILGAALILFGALFGELGGRITFSSERSGSC